MEPHWSVAPQTSPDLRNVDVDTDATNATALRNLFSDVKPKKKGKMNSSESLL